MTNEQIEMMLILRYGSIYGAYMVFINTPSANKVEFSNEEYQFMLVYHMGRF